VAEAATGQECLTQFEVFNPDVILMDLAMPLMDGWEAAYQIRNIYHSNVPIAIISANAFDKNLENSAKIPPEDFIVKPVNVQDLLNWLGKKMQIEWINEPEKMLALTSQNLNDKQIDLTKPPKSEMKILLKHINNGYIKGIQNQLNSIELLDERYTLFVSKMRQYVSEFEIDAMKQFIEELS
jgi:CheY-like chemotaxis protein